ncbi:MAG: hypothetical protein Q4P78_08400 [Rothia sp. (in: high G+C Gram-positive bacteria)]|uniref:hypothetical protein n=1 Tax=Rothia sp. (in: high G+C Gram-positive bacteria) TaxID=1885016 RepID=UPI0026E0D3F8|nr:hypothetical protein [Rothia sp. (in: high G+C Gram-positive bacteria)]MDO5751195.1 hypothetical protein [Rothia sp. (in: high G+C Gram-positive bacteria)]
MSVSPSCALISLDREGSEPHESLNALRIFLQEQGVRVLDNPSPQQSLDADMMILAGVSDPVECYERLTALDYERIVGRRVAGSRPVLGVQHAGYTFFDELYRDAPGMGGISVAGMGEWPGFVEPVLATVHDDYALLAEERDASSHMPVEGYVAPVVSGPDNYGRNFAIVAWEFDQSIESMLPPQVSWVQVQEEEQEANGREIKIVAVENGPLSALFAAPVATEAARAFMTSWLGAVRATGRI